MTVSSLHLYPIKSCRGVAVDAATATPRGFLHDREFLVVNAEGTFFTQRATPALALVEVELGPESLHLRAPGMGGCELPLGEPENAPERTVTIWRDTLRAHDVGEGPAAWFSDYLKQPCRVVRMGHGHRRVVPPEKIPAMHRKTLAGAVTSFADAYPYLLVTENSLDDLNARLPEPVPMDRFRPNLVLAGADGAYAEDGWQRLRVGDVLFYHQGPCVRCVMTTTDQRTLARGPEPLRTLAGYRRATDGKGVVFAMNFFSEGGTVRVGDPVEVLA